MSDLECWVQIKLPIKVVHYLKGRAATRWEPADPDEVDYEIDAPPEVREWLMDRVDRADYENIESEIIERAERNYAHMISEWNEERGLA